MDSISFRCIAKAFLNLIQSKFEEDDEEPNDEHFQIAEVLVEKLQELTYEYLFIDEEENVEGSTSDDMDYVDEDTEKNAAQTDEPSLEYKRNVLEVYDKHKGKWRFSTFQKKFPKLKHKSYIPNWRKHVLMGGTKQSIQQEIETHVMSCFRQAREEFLPVHDMDIRRWAVQKSVEFPEFTFKASDSWLLHFKKKNRIVSRKIQKFISFRAIRNMDQIQNDAESFRKKMIPIIAKYEQNKVWNTDQTGLRYEVLSTRTLSNKGERTTYGAAHSPKNKATHSYTVQYIIALDGSIVGEALICLQEKNGKFGTSVENQLFPAPNLAVVCSKSGKLTKQLVEEFLDTVVKPKAVGEILYITDKWTGHTDMELYNSRFQTDATNMQVEFIPENCTDLVQPLDTYFHRQFKYLIKQICSYAQLHENGESDPFMLSRNGILKLHSLVHFILSAPTFREMIRYCWYSSGLLEGEKPQFKNVKEICFLFENSKCSEIGCKGKPFIRCSWCLKCLCFDNFFHDYHVMYCTKSPYLAEPCEQ